MNLAAQQEQLPYFELIQTPIRQSNGSFNGEMKNIGHKCVDFFATCSVFILIGCGYIIYLEPDEWHYERKIDLKNNILSLDDAPATGYEAWEIYSICQKHKDSRKVEQMIEYLNTDQIKPDHIKEHFSDFLGQYKTSNRISKELIDAFEQAVGRNSLRDKPIKRKKKRVEISEINLLMSFQDISNRQHNKNLSAARKEAIYLHYPDITQDDFIAKDGALKSKIKYHFEGNEEIKYLFFDSHKNGPVSKIKHHFESNDDNDDEQEDELLLILEMIRNRAFK